ncbi:response regulator [bacterium]|nr:response regulator [bacterium]
MARILVIDDEKIIRTVVHRYLSKAGHEVEVAEDGNIGIEKFRRHPADLVITDIIMPNKEGIETIAELKSEYPDLKIIAMTGGGKAGPRNYLRLAKRFGASETFVKGGDWIPLCDMVEELLARD